MNILITGGAGFIGSNFIIYWTKKYPFDRIINLDALTYAGNLENLSNVVSKNYFFVKGNICDSKLVGKVMKNIDLVIHFAAESHVDRSITGPAKFIETNIIGTQILLEQAKKNKVKRFHHISTDEVFGSLAIKSKQKFNEKSPYNPASPYAASKAAADHLVRSYYRTFGLPITITNCSNNFGPFQYPEKLIPLSITNILEGKKIPLYGDGNYVRDWLYVTDHCTAIEAVLKKGLIGETYCIGGLTQDITNLQIIKRILNLMNKDDSWIKYVADRPGHDRKYALDWSKIKNHLHWQPRHSLDTYLTKTVDWYTANIHWWKKLKTGQK